MTQIDTNRRALVTTIPREMRLKLSTNPLPFSLFQMFFHIIGVGWTAILVFGELTLSLIDELPYFGG